MNPISFKRVFLLSSTMFLAVGGVLLLSVDFADLGGGDEPDTAIQPLVQAYPSRPAALPATITYPGFNSDPPPPSLLPAELQETLESIQTPQSSLVRPPWPLSLSYHEAVADPAYYASWLAAKNPGVHFRAIHATVTGYCPCPICCGLHARGITYTGVRTAIEPYGIAAPEFLVRHAVHVPGYMFESEPGKFWKADDTGGALNSDWENHVYHFDVRFMSHDWAMRWWGLRHMTIYIAE